MIRPLRRGHRALIAMVFVILFIATLIALTRRASDVVMDVLPSAVMR
jgi:hypothetical protein